MVLSFTSKSPKGGIRKRQAPERDVESPVVEAGQPQVRGGIRRRVEATSSSAAEDQLARPLVNSLRRDWGQGKLSAKQVVDYLVGAESQGADGMPKVASSAHPHNLQRSLMAAFGKPPAAPTFVWMEIPTSKGMTPHPFLLPHMWLASVHADKKDLWSSGIVGERGAIEHFWKQMRDSAFVTKHPHLQQAYMSKTVPVGLHGDAGSFSHHDSMFVFSWNSLVGSGSTTDTRFVIAILKKSLLVEGTMDAISKIMGWSFNVMLSGIFPECDWEGRKLPGEPDTLPKVGGGFSAKSEETGNSMGLTWACRSGVRVATCVGFAGHLTSRTTCGTLVTTWTRLGAAPDDPTNST